MSTPNELMSRRANRSAGVRGLTLVELMLALFVISVGLLALMSSIISSMVLTDVNRQEALSISAARSKFAELAAANFATCFTVYNNAGFAVPALASGNPGTVTFPTTGGSLSETVADTILGMPRDLNGNGSATDGNVSNNYVLLPIILRIQWQTVQGLRTMEFRTLLTSYK